MTPGMIDTGSGPLEVIGTGSVEGAPVILLHHGFGCAASLAHLAARLAERLPGRRLLGYSRPGCGISPPRDLPLRPDYLHREAHEVLPALMAALGIARADLVGHSDGGTIALLHAAARPGATGRVVAIAPHVMVEPVTLAGIAALARSDADPAFRARLAARHADPAAAYDSWRDAWLSAPFRDWDIRAEMAAIAAPLLLIQGSEDEFGTLAQLDEIASRARGPVRRLVLPGIRHAPQNEAPEAVADGIAAFLADDPARRAAF